MIHARKATITQEMLSAHIVALHVGRNHLDYIHFLWILFTAV